ncbi:hypothetical protein AB0M61_01685 [Streptomyces sp. NPDC051642]
MRRHFRSPLARYGFTTLAVLAAATGQLGPAVFAGALAYYAWKVR